MAAAALTFDLPLQDVDVLDGHLDDLGLLDSPLALFEVRGRDEVAQVGQAVVHAVAAPLLDDSVRHRVLGAVRNGGKARRHSGPYSWAAVLALRKIAKL